MKEQLVKLQPTLTAVAALGVIWLVWKSVK